MVGVFLVPEEGDVELDSEDRECSSAEMPPVVEVPPVVKSSSAVEKCCIAEFSKGKSEPCGDISDRKRSKSNGKSFVTISF
jgi:hypothetical protein